MQLLQAELKTIGNFLSDTAARAASTDSALDIFSRIKAMEAALETARKLIVPAANEEYVMKLASLDDAKKKSIPIPGVGRCKNYTKRGSWKWPDDVVKLESRLKVAQEKAKADGTAVAVPAEGGEDETDGPRGEAEPAAV